MFEDISIEFKEKDFSLSYSYTFIYNRQTAFMYIVSKNFL